MNAGLLKALSAAISDDPLHVLQLRKIVVALAISGRLNQTQDLVGPDELLAMLEDVRSRLVAQRLLPRQKSLVPITKEHLPENFSDPSLFILLGQIARVEKGKTGIKQAKPGDYPLVVTSAERLSADHFDFDCAAAIIPLVSSTGHGNASINRLHYQEGQFALGTILAAVFPYDPALFSARFLFEYLSAFKDELLVSRMSGTANVTLTLGRIEEVPIPLVPPMVQRKVDELMALCDQLEMARVERETTRNRLAAASLARLNSPDPETFPDDARFAMDALPALTARPDQIKQLRQTILNLAVRGKLVPQDTADEPADVLYTKARSAKETLRTDRGITRNEDPEFSTSLNEPYCPEHWLWAHLADFALVQGGKRLPAGADFSTEPTGRIYIRVTDMKNGTISSSSLKYVSESVHRAIAKYVINKEDIYITIAGTIGDVGEVPEFLDGHNLTENAAKIVFREIDRRFMVLVLSSDDAQFQFAEKTKQMAQPKLALKRILGARVPLPPLAEQHRIVAKVDELMALCDQLEASLTIADDNRRRLLDALLAEALAPVGTAGLQEAAE